ncbi:MAG: hypothetical protein WC415_03255 [Patescibacteria group bacterium]|jgi:hypothetical protein
MNKLVYKLSSGIFGGTILGITSFFLLLGYNEKHGECFSFANFLFNLAGSEYAGCRNPGVFDGVPIIIILSIVLGAFLGVFLIGMIKVVHYLRYSIILILVNFILLFFYFLYFNFDFLSEFLKINNICFIFSIVLIFVLFSVIPSAIIVLIAGWFKNKFKKISV